ncbi:phage head closure protein [Hahella sp. HN01]|uniref:phage head closure protein n=1 Tax=Hahella sp. HN01 TaxID=2847262 RepID=UPI001C1EA92C|nr:phage head closure protein [Hahella sp. HN01]MBU6955760.1 phage head closure protein [Hahella sp. HN01]
MRAGRLRRRVTIQVNDTTQDEYGETVQGWRELATRWAGVEPLSGREFLAASGPRAELTTRIVLRWEPALAGLTSQDHRVIYQGRVYDIHSAINTREENKEWVLMCADTGAAV